MSGAPASGTAPHLMPQDINIKKLDELVAQKNKWHRELTAEEKALGFPGWHHRSFLPHCDFPGLIQLVTFRLWDSMPLSRSREGQHLLAIEDDRKRRLKLEEYLDRGLGQCHLRDPEIAQLAERTLRHFNGVRYELLSWCVMPNHVHVLVHVWQVPLWKIVRSWKQFIATNVNHSERPPPARHNAQLAPLRWQREYWDTFMRDEKQERSAHSLYRKQPGQSGNVQESGRVELWERAVWGQIRAISASAACSAGNHQMKREPQ